METAQLLTLLTRPEAYPHPCETVRVCQTHISAVFLAGDYAYKIKKPLDLGFLNFSTLERRHHFCLEEVRLNRRLAPSVYLGAVPIALQQGRLVVGGEGEAVEWAVWMERLPEEATLARRLEGGEVSAGLLAAVAARLASFHRRAEGGPHVSAAARWPVVARNARENFEQAQAGTEGVPVPAVFERFRLLTEQALTEHRSLVEERAARGVPRDTHGDLRLDHVYVFPDRPPPQDLVIVDCVEFSERFRHADPVADAAFLSMDLGFRGRPDLAAPFRRAYAQEAEDAEGLRLFPLYEAYRAAVRAKVEGLRACEEEVPAPQREAARRSARAYWLFGLGVLEAPGRRPCLLGVGGLPGAGKSTLAGGLSERAGFTVLSTDRIRKELVGLPPGAPAAAPYGEGLYSADWDERTYAECLRRAKECLSRGGRVLVDGSFRQESRREALLAAGAEVGVPCLLLLCEIDPETVRRRLAARAPGPSDADWGVFLRAAAAWDEVGPRSLPAVRSLPVAGTPQQTLEAALGLLRAEGLA